MSASAEKCAWVRAERITKNVIVADSAKARNSTTIGEVYRPPPLQSPGSAGQTKGQSMLLITGAAGFIGGNFVHHWFAHSDEPVIVLDKLTYAGNPETIASHIDAGR